MTQRPLWLQMYVQEEEYLLGTRHFRLIWGWRWKELSLSVLNIKHTLHSEENHWLCRAEAGNPQSSVWGNRPDSKRSHQEIWRGSNPAGLWQLSPGQPPGGGNYPSFHPHLEMRLVTSHGEQSHFLIKWRFFSRNEPTLSFNIPSFWFSVVGVSVSMAKQVCEYGG